MAIYYYFPTKDTTIYEENTSQNTGKDEILELVKKNSNTKFDESVDVSLRINLKQSKGGDLIWELL